MKRIKGIDFVKFICSLLVVMIHVSPFGEATSSTKFYLMNDFLQNYICRLAVPFFFICNGYFLEKKLSVSGNDCTIIKNIVFKTLKLYIKWSIIYLPINLVIILHDKSGLLHGIIGYVKNFVFIGSYTQLWYLNSLIIALLLIYVFTKMKVQSSIIMKLSFVLYIIGLFDDSYYGILNFTPIIKTCVDKYNLLFGTTRNGLFFGLFFISLGMYLAKINLSIDYKKCVLLFTCSSMALFVEIYSLGYLGLSKDYNMYFFLIPSSFLLFIISTNINCIPDDTCKLLGEISKFVFLAHMWPNFILSKLFTFFPRHLLETPLKYYSVVCLTILTYFVIKQMQKVRLLNSKHHT